MARFLDAHRDPPLSGDFDRESPTGWSGRRSPPIWPSSPPIRPAGSTSWSWTGWPARRRRGWPRSWSSPTGLVVFDNADRWQYNAGYAALADAGFVRFDFYGTRPILVDESCTAIFARSVDWARVNVTIPRGRPSDIRW